MSEWQPIETAPRDGRELLMADGHEIKVCYPKRFPRPLSKIDDVDNIDSKGGDRWEYFRSEEFCPGHTFSMCPTHWMSLPPFP